jgi:hypothetical protein
VETRASALRRARSQQAWPQPWREHFPLEPSSQRGGSTSCVVACAAESHLVIGCGLRVDAHRPLSAITDACQYDVCAADAALCAAAPAAAGPAPLLQGTGWRRAVKRRPDKASYKLVSRTCSGAATRQRCSRRTIRAVPTCDERICRAHTRGDRCMIQSPALRWVISGVGVMARRPPNDGASWSARELQALRALAKAGTPTGQVAKKLGRTAAAVQQKAMRAGISFRAAKRSGARRKK